jgi:acyl dehydratase
MRLFKSVEEMRPLLGSELGVSDWVRVSQDSIDTFARLTGDDQWIHVDVERVKRELPEGRTLVHGFLTLSLIPKLRQQIWKLASVARGLNYGVDKVRFPSPVLVGEAMRLRNSLISIEPLGEGWRMRFGNTMEIEGKEKPGCVAETISVFYERK